MHLHDRTAIVLAAGGSTRFGSPKQLHLYNGESLIQRAVKAAADAGADPVIVVLGAEANTIRKSIDDSRAQIVVNENWSTGLASSLATGMNAVDATCDGILVTLADQPLVDATALGMLIAAFDSGHRIVASSYGGTIGVPAMFGMEFRDALSRLSGDAGAGLWIRERLREATIVQLDQAAHDVDTPSDALRLEETAS